MEFVDIETGEVFDMKVLSFGKHKGLTILEILSKDPNYPKWLYINVIKLDRIIKQNIVDVFE